jgi:tetraacyldisaccharide 4'-kinase
MLNYLRLLLWPFSLLYGFIIILRNKAYDWGILKSEGFDIPIIVVGNLAVGGAGKSPMTEYLIRMFEHIHKVATLSRGYGRKTKGFLLVEKNDDPIKVGDEPLQFKRKYPKITVAVCEDRVEGVKKLKMDQDLIILDDAFQHRGLKPGFSILLLEYKSLFQPKFLLPAGDFRDTFNQRKRAHIIVISKSPESLSANEKEQALKHVKASSNQKVLFSYLRYGQPYWLNRDKDNTEKSEEDINKNDVILVVTGIANPSLLVDYLKSQAKEIYLLKYPDHHHYTKRDIKNISAKFELISDPNKRIVTTEKDAQRLKINSLSNLIYPLPILVLPIETAFSAPDQEILSEDIYNYCNSKNNT